MSESPEILNLSLTELRRTYDHELTRRSSLEEKASALFGFTSVVITVLIFSLSYLISSEETPFNVLLSLGILDLISLFIIILGLKYLFDVIKLRMYRRPYETDPNKILQLIDSPEDVMYEYRRSIFQTYCLNDKKADSIELAMKLLFIGILILILSLIMVLWIKMGVVV